MVPPQSQVAEQVVRVTIGIYFASKLMPYGIEYSVAGLAAGTMLGELIGLLVLAFTYKSHKGTPLPAYSNKFKVSTTGKILMNIFAFAVPVSLSRLINSLLLALQAIVIPLRLQVAGNTLRQATELYGQFSGIALSLLGIPTIFTLSLPLPLCRQHPSSVKKDYRY